MKKIYTALVLIQMCLLASTSFAQIPTTRTLKWNLTGNKNWPTVGAGNSWDNKANWINTATGLAPATNVANGDKLIIPSTSGLNILITSSFTIPFTNFVIEIQGNGEIDIQSGVTLTLSGAVTGFNLLGVTSTNGLTLQARKNPGAIPTQLIMNGIVKALNTTASAITTTTTTTSHALSIDPAAAVVTGYGGFLTGALPVILTSFNASLTSGKQVTLSWTTEQEVNSDFFDVEKSVDAVNWNSIGTLKAAGSSSNPLTYNFVDNNPSKGSNFYRVRINDLDGKFVYTPVKNVRLNESGKISLFPNPSSDVLNISLGDAPAADWSVSLINYSGQMLIQKKFSKNTSTVSIPVYNYPSGNYLLRITDGKTIQTNKLMISHY
jgi:hypothetical protein